MLDLGEIRERLKQAQDTETFGLYWAAKYATDIPALIAEVERLRKSQAFDLNATIDCLQEKSKADAVLIKHYQDKITAANDMLDEMCEACCVDNDGCIVERMNTRDCFNKRMKEVLK